LGEYDEQDRHWMLSALECAKQAKTLGEVPIGAVLVLENVVLAQGGNQSIQTCDPSAHAEIVVLRQAAKKIGNYRLPGAVLYVTLEPCIMCWGAMLQARIAKVVFAAKDAKFGVCKHSFLHHISERANHRLEYCGGLMQEEATILLQQFFKERR
jgi:tRNA(adenine34) deaminase